MRACCGSTGGTVTHLNLKSQPATGSEAPFPGGHQWPGPAPSPRPSGGDSDLSGSDRGFGLRVGPGCSIRNSSPGPGPAADSGVEATSLRLGGWARVTRLRDQQRACRGPGNLERSLEMPESHYPNNGFNLPVRAEWLPFGHTIPNVILRLLKETLQHAPWRCRVIGADVAHLLLRHLLRQIRWLIRHLMV